MESNSNIRRINLYGGPGVGKSTLASDLFAEFKRSCIDSAIDRQFELIQEYVKRWAWEGRNVKGFDQVFIFANQQRLEEIPLRAGVHHIFTDSPLFLGAAYARKYHSKTFGPLISLAELHEEKYPGLHIFLERGDRPYVAKGRYEDESSARKMDDYIMSLLDLYVGSDNYLVLPYNDWPRIISTTAEKLGLSEHLNPSKTATEKSSSESIKCDARAMTDYLSHGGSDF